MLTVLRPLDPEIWMNMWRANNELYKDLLRRKNKGEKVDEEMLNDLRNNMREYLLKVHLLDPENYHAPWYLGDIYLEEGNYEESMKWYKISLEKRETVSVLERLFDAYRRAGKYNEAIGTLKRILELRPYYYKYYPELVSLYLMSGLEDEAKMVIEKLVQTPAEEYVGTYARTLEYYRVLAERYEKVGNIEGALKYLEQIKALYQERAKR